eukprot:TRINITY_DN5736_c0_g1_i1.p1 TRINITY_DN5736_c0_g1~~TRINITY_DN5736_c0_g1_i1.p1  ORF type:complete len:288 (-),score=73.78 TRINITY_DN5736_c0_g1_i1:68-931(-)
MSRSQELEKRNPIGISTNVFKEDFLAGKVALVTGGATGISFSITKTLMKHGCNTAIMSRKMDKLKTSAAELEQSTGKKCFPVSADVRDPKQVEAAIDQVLQHFGRIDILINGAAGNFLCAAEALSYNAFRTVIEIDTIGTYNVTKAVFTKFMKDNGGNIINLSATLQYNGTPLQVHAGSAKAAIDAMTKHLAVEWGPLGIRVNTIAIGPIDNTEGMSRLAPKGYKEMMIRGVALQRWGDVSEIANATLFLVSDAASFVHGSIFVVDGGSWLSGAAGPIYPDLLPSKL